MTAHAFALLRHAESLWSRDRRISGQEDVDLSPSGEAQARGMAEWLAGRGFERIVASDLRRARLTAEIIASRLELPVQTDVRLREIDWGAWTGRTFAELARDLGGEVQRRGWDGWDFRPDGGESRAEVAARGLAALNDLTALAAGCVVRRTLVVCHLGLMRCVLFRALGLRFLPGEADPVKKSRVHWLAQGPGGPRLALLNQKMRPRKARSD